MEGSAAPQETESETSGLAIASVFLGIVWIFGLASIPAIVLGLRARREIEASAGALDGNTLAVAGIAIGIAGLAGTALLLAFLLGFH